MLTAGCQRKPQDTPTPKSTGEYDVLAKAEGRWVWDKSMMLGGNLTPASKGFTRQLVFRSDSTVAIYRNQALYASPTFQRTSGTLPRCGQPQSAVPLINYPNETDLFNTARKTYRLSTVNGVVQLMIIGETACIDAGSYEVYHWEPVP